MKTLRQVFGWMLVGAALIAAGCTFFPHVDLGVDFDYYGGKFHVRPNASVGITGRP